MFIIKIVNNIPIKLKFISVYLVCILLPMVVVYGIFFTQLSKEVELRENNVIQQVFNNTYTELSYLLNGGRAIARDIKIGNDVNELLDTKYASSSAYYKAYINDLKDEVERYVSTYNNVVRVSLYTDNPTIINGGSVYIINERVLGSEWYQKYLETGQDEQILAWIEPHPVSKNYYLLNISIMRRLDTFSLYDNYNKYVRVDLENDSIKRHIESDAFMDFALVNNKGEIIISSFTRSDQPSFEQLDLDAYGNDFIIVQKRVNLIEGQDWNLIGIAPRSSLLSQLSHYGFLIVLLFFVSLAFSLLMIYIFSHSYNSRIRLLQYHMEQVENSNFDIITQDMGKDEIGLLIHSFNQMTLQINDLVNEVFEFQLKEKEHQLESVRAELKFLQSQMDPHFLFNTLNAILVVCNRNQYKEITDIIKYLSKTLRYLIQWNDDLVRIGEEVEFTKMYLHIEKFRFQDKFHFHIDIEEGLEKIFIPKMIIQPFVENACKHGIQASKRKGEVNIRICCVNGFVQITIEDNGIGMSSDQLQSIIIQKDDHIGIQNVYRRLKLYYQSDCHCYIESTQNKGTTVHINLPSLRDLKNEEEGTAHV